MPQKFVNEFSTTLAVAAGSGDGTITLQAGDGAKLEINGTITTANFINLTLDDGTNVEIVRGTSITGDVVTVLRGQGNTIAQNFTIGDLVEMRIVAESMIQITKPYADIETDASTARTLAAVDEGKVVYLTATSLVTLTLPQTSTESIPAGYQVSFINAGAGGSIGFATQGTDSLVSEQSFTSVSVQYGTVTVIKLIDGSPNTWHISGSLQ